MNSIHKKDSKISDLQHEESVENLLTIEDSF